MKVHYIVLTTTHWLLRHDPNIDEVTSPNSREPVTASLGAGVDCAVPLARDGQTQARNVIPGSASSETEQQ